MYYGINMNLKDKKALRFGLDSSGLDCELWRALMNDLEAIGLEFLELILLLTSKESFLWN
jgi:hypothetical protein